MRIPVAAATLGAGFALLACSSIPTVPAATVSSDGKSWRSNGLPVHTGLTGTQDSIVYGGVEGRLYVVALDPATGMERWRRLSDVSGRVQGVEQSIFTDDDTAYFLAGGEPSGWTSILVAVTTATGEERWRRDLELAYVDPDAFSCGDAVCIVTMTSGEEIWKLSNTDGTYVSKTPISEIGHDAMLGIDLSGSADATLLMASRPESSPTGVVYITQFGGLRKTKEWSKPAPELFGETPVSPNDGWNSIRVDGGWIASLGRRGEKRSKYKVGDIIRPGVVAGFDDRGNSRWIAVGLEISNAFESSSTAALSDGAWRVISEGHGERRPNAVEGRDATTGTVSWKLDLHGEINEWNTNAKVLRIDENRYLVDLSSGPILLDLGRGPEPAPQGLTAGWCKPEQKGDEIVRRGVSGPRPFAQAMNAFPCRLGGDRVAEPPALPIPKFAGVNVSGWGAWVEDGQVHAKHE